MSFFEFLFPFFFSSDSSSVKSKDRLLRGAMRVGLVAKGLLLKDDRDLELVLLCAIKPTVTMLKEVAETLTAQLEVERYPYSLCHILSSASLIL